MKLTLDNVDAFFFDFDGVITNNFVYLDQEGRESVRCSRADGLAFDALHKFYKPVFIISTERNPVVEMRAKKLKTPALLGVNNKVKAIKAVANFNSFELNRTFFVGNDLNDYYAMKLCGYSACPADSHPKIKKISNVTLNSKGGDGVIRDLLENIFDLDIIKALYSIEEKKCQ